MTPPWTHKTPEDRAHIFQTLRGFGFNVPDFDLVSKLEWRHKENDVPCVVYTDKGSLLMYVHDAAKLYPTHMASLYIGKRTRPSTMTRWMQLGPRAYWFNFTSQDSWNSKQGDAKCELLHTVRSYHPNIHLPLFSIDFVHNPSRYAIDFDTIPSIRNTPLVGRLDRKEVIDLVNKGIAHFSAMKHRAYKFDRNIKELLSKQ